MKKRMSVIVLILSAILIFSACSSNSSSENNTNTNQETGTNIGSQGEENQEPEGTENKDDTSSDETQDTDDTSLAELPVTVAQLEAGLDIGSSQKDITNLLGDQYQEVTAVMDESNVWRYDIGTTSDYTYANEMDMPDTNGLNNGNIALQIFVYLDSEGKAAGYSAYQADGEGKVNVHQLLGDGTKKVESM